MRMMRRGRPCLEILPKVLISTMFLLLLACADPNLPAAGAAPSEKTFNSDLAYYHRISRKKNLNANDRVYILDRLRKKYRDAEFDLSELYAEIDHWSGIRAEKKAKLTAEDEKKEEETVREGALTNVMVTDGEEYSRVILEVEGDYKFKDDLKKDDRGAQPPVIILYLYGVREFLKPSSRNFRVSKGMVRQVQIQTISTDPPTTKMSVSLRKDRPYRVTRNNNQIILSVNKREILPEAPPTAPETKPLVPVPEAAASGVFLDRGKDFMIIETGDILKVTFSGVIEFTHETIVQADGTVRMPMLGRIAAGGRTVMDIEAEVSKKILEYSPKATVSIEIHKFVSKQIFLMGQVISPGVYNIDQPVGVLDLINRSGGFLGDADKKNVVLYRQDGDSRTMLIVNVEASTATGISPEDNLLAPGDVIEVPRSMNLVYVVGAVKSQGRYKFTEGMTLMQTIYLAGGFDKNAHLGRVRIIRSDQEKKTAVEIDIEDLIRKRPESDVELKEGDLITVPEKGVLRRGMMTGRLLSWLTFLISLGLVLAVLI